MDYVEATGNVEEDIIIIPVVNMLVHFNELLIDLFAAYNLPIITKQLPIFFFILLKIFRILNWNFMCFYFHL